MELHELHSDFWNTISVTLSFYLSIKYKLYLIQEKNNFGINKSRMYKFLKPFAIPGSHFPVWRKELLYCFNCLGLFLFECQNCPLSLQLKYNTLYFFLFSNEPVTWNFSTTVYWILFFYMDYWSRNFFGDLLMTFCKLYILCKNTANEKHAQQKTSPRTNYLYETENTNGTVSCCKIEMTWTLDSSVCTTKFPVLRKTLKICSVLCTLSIIQNY